MLLFFSSPSVISYSIRLRKAQSKRKPSRLAAIEFSFRLKRNSQRVRCDRMHCKVDDIISRRFSLSLFTFHMPTANCDWSCFVWQFARHKTVNKSSARVSGCSRLHLIIDHLQSFDFHSIFRSCHFSMASQIVCRAIKFHEIEWKNIVVIFIWCGDRLSGCFCFSRPTKKIHFLRWAVHSLETKANSHKFHNRRRRFFCIWRPMKIDTISWLAVGFQYDRRHKHDSDIGAKLIQFIRASVR